MDGIEKKPVTGLKSSRIDLDNGWFAKVMLCGPDHGGISIEQWQRCLSDPRKLLEDAQRVIKTDGRTQVIVKPIKLADNSLPVAIKSENLRPGFKGFFRSLRTAKGIRNFDTAEKLLTNGIPAVFPVAAIYRKQGMRITQSIYITGYADSSNDMQTFVRENIGKIDFSLPHIKRQFCFQIAEILAALDKCSLWHRDAKAGNFLVIPTKNGDFKVALVDMDGIKHYLIPTAKRRYFAFTKLGAGLIWHRGINLTDYLRSFRIYCNLCKVDKQKSDNIFRRLCRSAIALRLLTFAGSAIRK